LDTFTKSGLSITRQAAFLLGKSINNKDIMLTATKNNIKTKVTHLLADTVTPVSIYLKVRDHFNNPVLLESNDFRSRENCYSIIGLEPIAGFKVQQGAITRAFTDGSIETETIVNPQSVVGQLDDFIKSFEIEHEDDAPIVNGFLGHTSFEAVQYFDTLEYDLEKQVHEIPDINYQLYRFLIVVNHFKDELFIIENLAEGQTPEAEKVSTLLESQNFGTYKFELEGEEASNLTDEEFKKYVTLGKHHCQVGDVFQIVLSRQFSQSFKGDEFNVYRILRSINPSPYLFYFDYGSYKIFGSSPEAQLVVKENVASVNPIAGTYRRTGNDAEDAKKAKELLEDPKENAEHVMLVDLARNDLGRHTKNVRIKELKEVQFFSHVIHLVSKVEGDLNKNTSSIQVFGDTFPAGTLSGAPKYKALELIHKYENQLRGYYGGSIGFIDFNGNINQAIIIRTFLSKDNTLYSQSGAGIVVSSDEENELQEVNNKLRALKQALIKAEKL
jgi:anthranilate synthase component 1